MVDVLAVEILVEGLAYGTIEPAEVGRVGPQGDDGRFKAPPARSVETPGKSHLKMPAGMRIGHIQRGAVVGDDNLVCGAAQNDVARRDLEREGRRLTCAEVERAQIQVPLGVHGRRSLLPAGCQRSPRQRLNVVVMIEALANRRRDGLAGRIGRAGATLQPLAAAPHGCQELPKVGLKG